MRGLERSWDTPFDPSEVGKQAMFVWCKTKDDARNLFAECYPGARTEADDWIQRWDSWKEETIYAIPRNPSENWLYGSRDSYHSYWKDKGYVPRQYGLDFPASVEVGDLL